MDAHDSKNTYHRCCKPEVGRGCAFCDAETGGEPEAVLSDGCFKLHETPWLEAYPDNFPTDIFEVRFKNTRRSFYQNVNNLPLKRGDIVAVEASPGHDIGIISLTGDMVAKQMRRTGFNPFNGEFRKIYRKAKPYDIERWQEAIALEHETMIASRQIAADMGLNMKIGDVEYQGDKIKAIFYYIADERVDFRELIKVFAERFHIRIEMKQIGARQEAGRIGGLGACGRELCCASWISSFSSVTTGAARMQDLSLNPQKLAGQCSKLKCCLMYEYDVYAEARREFPRLREPLQTLDGEYFLVKSDILAGTMTFSTSKEAMANVVTLPVSRVKEIIALNRAGQKVDRLLETEAEAVAPEEPGFRAEEDSITRFDQSRKRGKNRRNRNKNGTGRPDTEAATPQDAAAPSESEQPQPEGGDRKPRKQQHNRPQPAAATAAAAAPEAETAATGEPRTPRNGGGEGGRERRNNRNDRNNRRRNGDPANHNAESAREPRGEAPSAREAQSPREPREPQSTREPRGEARTPRDAQPTQESQAPREPRKQQPRGNRPARGSAERGENRPRRDGGPGAERRPNGRGQRAADGAAGTAANTPAPQQPTRGEE